MKKIKGKIIAIFISIFAISILFTGCGNETVKGDKVASAFYNMFIKQDLSEVKEIGMTDDECQTAIDAYKDAIQNQVRTNFATGGLTITDNDLDRIINAEFSMLKKLNADVEIVSEDKDSCEIKLATTYVNISELDEKAANDAISEVKNLNLASQTQLKNKLVEKYIDNLVNALENAEPSSDKKENTFVFNKQKLECGGKVKEVYVPEDYSAFGKSIGDMASGVE